MKKRTGIFFMIFCLVLSILVVPVLAGEGGAAEEVSLLTEETGEADGIDEEPGEGNPTPGDDVFENGNDTVLQEAADLAKPAAAEAVKPMAKAVEVSVQTELTADESGGTKKKVCCVAFENGGSSIDMAGTGIDKSSYIAQKKTEFESALTNLTAGDAYDEVQTEDYASLFTENTYAVITDTEFAGNTFKFSNDAIFDGDLNVFDEARVLQGTVTGEYHFLAKYKLYTVYEKVDTVSLSITPPAAGSSVSASVVNIEGAIITVHNPEAAVTVGDSGKYAVAYSLWIDNETGEILIPPSPTDTKEMKFEAGKEYTAVVQVSARDGYFFSQGTSGTGAEISGGTLSGAPMIYNYTWIDENDGSYHAESVMELRATVSIAQAEDYFSVWMCDTDHKPNTGGSVKIEYLCSDGTVPADSGKVWTGSTNQTVPAGTTVTLTADCADDYTFAGWYQANINRTSADDPYYLEEKLVSSNEVYVFSGNPVGEGETPYICAVFEKKPANTHTVNFYADEGYDKLLYSMQVEDGAALRDPADGAKPVHPDHPNWKFDHWSLWNGEIYENGDHGIGMRIAFNKEYSYIPTIKEDMNFFATWGVAYRYGAYNLNTGKAFRDCEGGHIFYGRYIINGETHIETTKGPVTGGNWTYGEYNHMSMKMIAEVEDGYDFAGWYVVPPGGTVEENGTLLSTELTFDYTPENGTNQSDSELNTLFAVFKKTVCEVSFDSGTGSGKMDSQSVDAGTEFELPACGFSWSREGYTGSFHAWLVDGKEYKPGDKITVNADTRVKAIWDYQSKPRENRNDSTDRSTTTVKGELTITDTRTGEKSTKILYEETTASAYTDPSNPTVQVMISEAADSLMDAAKKQAGSFEVTVINQDTSLSILKTENNLIHKDEEETDNNGDICHYTHTTGSWGHHWQYAVTMDAEFTSHIHIMEKTDEVPAGCLENGMAAYWTCSICNKVFSDENGGSEVTDMDSLIISAKGHDWNDWVVTKEATKKETGERQRICKRDETHVETEVIPASSDNDQTQSGLKEAEKKQAANNTVSNTGSDSGKSAKSPKTGDANTLAGWIIMLCTAAAAAVFVAVAGKKRKTGGR